MWSNPQFPADLNFCAVLFELTNWIEDTHKEWKTLQ